MNLIKIADYDNNGLDLEQTLVKAETQELRIPNNLEIDQRLVKTEDWKKEKEMYPCRTGTFFAYESPNVPLGKKIEWEGYSVIVPKEFQGKKNIALVCNHPHFKLENKIFSSDKFTSIEIPIETGWYQPEDQFGFPTGKKYKDREDHLRFLWRYTGQPYLGLLVRRYFDFDDYGRRFVDAGVRPYVRFGVFGIKGDVTVPKHQHRWECLCGAKK